MNNTAQVFYKLTYCSISILSNYTVLADPLEAGLCASEAVEPDEKLSQGSKCHGVQISLNFRW